MTVREDMLTTREAAALLNVSVQRVNRLLETGAVTRVARGLVDRASVDRYLAERAGGRKRVWAEHTAWGAIALLSGRTSAPWLGQVQGSRLRKSLGDLADETIDPIGELVVRLRDRAKATTYTGHRSVSDRLRNDLCIASRASLGLVDQDSVVDGYASHLAIPSLVDKYRLRQDSSGSITLRATTFDLHVVEGLVTGSSVVAALDAATSLDPRERGVGEQALAETLETFRQ